MTELLETKMNNPNQKIDAMVRENIKFKPSDNVSVKKADEESTKATDDLTNQYPFLKEANEEIEIPELETKNYRIDLLLSQKEKLAGGWKEEESFLDIKGQQTKIKILKKELAPGAYVWEYQNDGNVPSNVIGEQIFNWKAVLVLGLQNRLPTRSSISGLIKMQAKSPFDNFDVCYKNFKEKYFQTKCGYWHPDYKEFRAVGSRAEIWLADDQNGQSVLFNNDDFNDHGGAEWPERGLPLRLLKK